MQECRVQVACSAPGHGQGAVDPLDHHRPARVLDPLLLRLVRRLGARGEEEQGW